MYQMRRRPDGYWQDCTECEAREILSAGYFDPTPAFDLMREGETVATSTHEVRMALAHLTPQRSEPTPEANGDILFAQ